jgi:hypothetical protein
MVISSNTRSRWLVPPSLGTFLTVPYAKPFPDEVVTLAEAAEILLPAPR